MSDDNDSDEVLEALTEAVKRHPHLRVGQLINNAVGLHLRNLYKDLVTDQEIGQRMFYMHDPVLAKILRHY